MTNRLEDLPIVELIDKLEKVNTSDFSTMGGMLLTLALIKEAAERLRELRQEVRELNEKVYD